MLIVKIYRKKQGEIITLTPRNASVFCGFFMGVLRIFSGCLKHTDNRKAGQNLGTGKLMVGCLLPHLTRCLKLPCEETRRRDNIHLYGSFQVFFLVQAAWNLLYPQKNVDNSVDKWFSIDFSHKKFFHKSLTTQQFICIVSRSGRNCPDVENFFPKPH